MHLTHLKIEGFRGLRNVDLKLEPKTVLLAENNSGKTSILDAIRLALRPRGQRTGPDELDFTLGTPETKTFAVTLSFDSTPERPWPDACIQQLESVTQLDTAGERHVRMRYSATKLDGQIEERWEFLNLVGDFLRPKDPDTMRRRLQKLVPLFQLETVRDAQEQFSSRNSLWASLLRGVEIDDEEREGLEAELRTLNEKVLTKAPQVKKASDTISGLHSFYLDRTQKTLMCRPSVREFRPCSLVPRLSWGPRRAIKSCRYAVTGKALKPWQSCSSSKRTSSSFKSIVRRESSHC